MRLTDAQAATETAQELVDLLAAYEQELAAWDRWTPAAAPLRLAIVDAMVEARELIATSAPTMPAQAQAH